ncbi:MAG: hypothetical protein KAW56_00620 [Candidatus Marinimicrobia bacterium]|nr:hypothetical protein [Candidatus Neomarinimicrobiota bacterium]
MDEIKDLGKRIIVLLTGQKWLLSIADAAGYSGVSRYSVYRLLANNSDIVTLKEPSIGRMIVKSTLDKHYRKKSREHKKRLLLR